MTLDAVPWKTLGAVPPASLESARLELHHAVQLLASFGQTLVDPRPDDSHRSVTWSASDSAFLSEVGGDASDVRVALAPGGLEVSIHAAGERIAESSLLGGGIEDAYVWVQDQLRLAPGAGAGAALGRPEYEIPHHVVADGASFTGGEEGALHDLSLWYGNACALLQAVRSAHPEATDVGCWPHHFDIATLLVLDPDLGAEHGRSVGVGLSPGDDDCAVPYWYVNPYPYPEASGLPSLPSGGNGIPRAGWARSSLRMRWWAPEARPSRRRRVGRSSRRPSTLPAGCWGDDLASPCAPDYGPIRPDQDFALFSTDLSRTTSWSGSTGFRR